MSQTHSARTQMARTTVFALTLIAGLGVAAQAADEPITLNVWHYEGTNPKGMIALDEAFEKAHPNIHINLYKMKAYTGPELVPQTAAGEGPDVVWADGTLVPGWRDAGLIQPLTRWVKAAGITRDQFVPPAWDQGQWAGDTWALPLYVDANFGVVSNRDLLEAAGVEPPRTIQELDAIQPKLAKVASDGHLTQFGLVPWSASGVGNAVYTWGWAFGGDFFDPAARRVTANDPPIISALDWMAEPARRYGFDNVNNLTQLGTERKSGFMREQTAMWLVNNGLLTGWVKARAPQIRYELSQLPYDARTVDSPQPWIGGFTLTMGVGSKHPDAAWEYIKFATTDPHGTALFTLNDGSFPGLLASEAFPALAKDPDAAFFLDVLRAAKHARPPIADQSQYYAALNSQTVDVLKGLKPAKEVLDAITVTIQQDFDELMAKSGQ